MPAQLHRRRAASSRCEPLADGRRDPLDSLDDEPITDREVASWRAAWRHLHGHELPAVVPQRVVARRASPPRGR